MVERTFRSGTQSKAAQSTRSRLTVNLEPTHSKLKSPSFLIAIFMASLAIPASFYLGPVRLSPYRVFLIIFFLPIVANLLSGKLGRVRRTDICIILFAVWGALSIFVTMSPPDAFESSGIFVVESLGAYLMGRKAIQDERAFLFMVKVLLLVIALLLPFAVYEAITDIPILIESIRPIMSVVEKPFREPRFGLHRAQVVFEHPILFGTFATSAFGLSIYTGRHIFGRITKNLYPFLVVLASVLSVSSGALAALMAQCIFMAWNKVTHRMPSRWTLLAGGFGLIYLTIDMISNRSPFHVIVTYLTFSPGSAYNRILIWNYGSAEVWRHPLFGIGFSDWSRPSWMSSSMDNFWLVIAVRHGVPALMFLALGISFLVKDAGRLVILERRTYDCRVGLFVSLAGFIVAGCTVDYWNAIYCWFMFLIGSGMWILNADESTGRNVDSEIRTQQPQVGQVHRSRSAVPYNRTVPLD